MDQPVRDRIVPSDSVSLALAILVVVVAGCEAGESHQAKPELRDSAGIIIAENPGPDYEVPEWKLSDAPVVTVGATEGASGDALYRVAGAVRLGDGRIAVANSGTHEVRFYGPDGDLRQTVGGEGEGPGEYRSLDGLIRTPRDTLIVQDSDLRRLTWLSPEGERVRSVRNQVGEGDLNLMFMRLEGLLRDSLVFVATPVRGTFIHDEGSIRTDSVRVLLVGPNGVGSRGLVNVVGTETWVRSTSSEAIAMPVPFGAAVHHASGGGRFFLGRSDRYEITVYGDSGAPVLLIRRPSQHRPVTAADREAFEDDFLAEAAGVDRYRQARQRLLEEVPFATVRPQFAGLVATREGDLWVREPGPRETDSATWAIYGPEGLLKGRARMPADLEIQEVGVDFLLALQTDDLGVERIDLWELRAPETVDR